MAKDKIDVLLNDWIETQESRIDKMRPRVRVKINTEQYYSELKVTAEEIIIKPMDDERPVVTFYECHLDGCKEIKKNGIKLNQRFERPGYKLFFRTPNQRQRTLKRLRKLIGYESTPKSTATDSDSD